MAQKDTLSDTMPVKKTDLFITDRVHKRPVHRLFTTDQFVTGYFHSRPHS